MRPTIIRLAKFKLISIKLVILTVIASDFSGSTDRYTKQIKSNSFYNFTFYNFGTVSLQNNTMVLFANKESASEHHERKSSQISVCFRSSSTDRGIE
jgi:hypothetical protein